MPPRPRLFELGVPAAKTSVLSNFVPAAQFAAASRAGDGDFALASGRIVEEKGFDTAVLRRPRRGRSAGGRG